jgi:hypothetical protein
MKDLVARIGARPGVAATDLSGRAEYVDLLLATLPTFARVMFAGPAREQLTIDFYQNVHRKGLLLHSGTFDPSLEMVATPDGQPAPRIVRAATLLTHPDRAAVCRACLESGGSLG